MQIVSWRNLGIFSRLACCTKRANLCLRLRPVLLENNGRMLNEFLR